MNYIGSKLKLCQTFLPRTIRSVCGDDLSQMVFCDIFAGTGIVGKTFKRYVKKVISNDFEFFSYVLNKNYIENSSVIPKRDDYLNQLNTLFLIDNGFIYKNYCLGGSGIRQYFSDENGKKIDTVRTAIEDWKNKNEIKSNLYFFLLCSLLESADKVANTTSVYGAFLKELKRSAQKPLVLEPAEYELSDNHCKVYKEDANILIRKIQGDILYIDPPYNKRQYGSNYHILNTIAEYKAFTPIGKTGLREYLHSKYCSVTTVKSEFEDLIKRANFKYIFLSYNNEGLMSCEEIKNIMSKYGRYDLVQTEHQRFKADSSRVSKASSTTEFLHILEKS